MMLTGWKMLSQVCPVCSFPLMGKDGNMMCPGCNVPVIRETSLAPKQSQSEAVPVDVEEVEKEEEDDDDEVDSQSITKTYEEMRREYDEKNSQQRTISTKLGQKMLLGWTLLGKSVQLSI